MGKISTIFLSVVVLSSVTAGLGLVTGGCCVVLAVLAGFVFAELDNGAVAFCEEPVLAVFWAGTVAACWVVVFKAVA